MKKEKNRYEWLLLFNYTKYENKFSMVVILL